MRLNSKKRSYYQIFLLIVLGIVVFSPFITTLCLNILSLPMVFPELLFLPFCVFLRKKIKSIQFDTRLFMILFLISLSLLVLALIIGRFQIGGVLSIYRSYLYLIIGYCAFSKQNDVNNNDILLIMFGSLLGWLYDSHENFQNLIVDFDMSNLTFGLILSIPLFLSIAIYKRNYIIFVLGLCIMSGIFVFSGIRRIIAVFLISLLVIFILQSLGNIKRIFSAVFLSFSLILILNDFLPQVENFIQDVSPQLHYRMFVRTEDSLSGNAGTADNSRASNITSFFDEGAEMFFPHGFYTNHTSENGAGVYNDMPLKGLVWIFGLPLTAFLFFYFIKLFIKTYRNYRIHHLEDAFPYLVSFVIILIMLFLDGSFLSYSYCAPITGLCLGKLKHYALTYENR